ncbi:glycosyltransferase [Thalassomonas actiniarum]|uniref:Glycosyltransferase n=1 Tax=Thalassomonas actiniarum TaxID=485447 RepID=A0AAE9YY26_9GAMM|nr:glycosyltransferase [Thalassomonas actiniarum]WDE01628.1 glycosyltransferase [Thalassomonas actiniarum]
MRIFVQARHKYPAAVGGPGGGRVFDALVKGLAQLGHQVVYYLENSPQENLEQEKAWQQATPPANQLPANVTFVDEPVFDADIYHIRSDSGLGAELERRGLPWVATCHTDLAVHGLARSRCRENWIYVSPSLARTYGSKRFIYNGIDPSEFIFREQKSDYLLFVSALPLARRKGLDIAIDCAREARVKLVVAGSSSDKNLIREITRICHVPGVEYVGEIFGEHKAELFAGARALLFPTQINEAFGLVLAEAMISGTPVITSDKGACMDIVNSKVGFVCHHFSQYLEAVKAVDSLSAHTCRQYALDLYHYRHMARAYVQQYRLEINKSRSVQMCFS